MKLQLNSPRAKIIAASSFVLIGSVIGVVLNLGGTESAETMQAENVQKEQVRHEKKPPTLQEMDALHSSWLFSSSESAALVDQQNGYETATIGR